MWKMLFLSAALTSAAPSPLDRLTILCTEGRAFVQDETDAFDAKFLKYRAFIEHIKNFGSAAEAALKKIEIAQSLRGEILAELLPPTQTVADALEKRGLQISEGTAAIDQLLQLHRDRLHSLKDPEEIKTLEFAESWRWRQRVSHFADRMERAQKFISSDPLSKSTVAIAISQKAIKKLLREAGASLDQDSIDGIFRKLRIQVAVVSAGLKLIAMPLKLIESKKELYRSQAYLWAWDQPQRRESFFIIEEFGLKAFAQIDEWLEETDDLFAQSKEEFERLLHSARIDAEDRDRVLLRFEQLRSKFLKDKLLAVRASIIAAVTDGRADDLKQLLKGIVDARAIKVKQADGSIVPLIDLATSEQIRLLLKQADR